MDKALLTGLIASIIRWLGPWLYGITGFEFTEARVGEAAAWIVGGVLFVGSIIWSWKEKKKLLAIKPKSGGAP